MTSNKLNDNFPCRCRAVKLDLKRCTRRARWLVAVTDRESWLEALKSGWPMLVKGMQEPRYIRRGLCNTHMKLWDKTLKSNAAFRMDGESYGYPELDSEYKEAVKQGDEKAGTKRV